LTVHAAANVLAGLVHAGVLTFSARDFDPSGLAVSAGQSYAYSLIDHAPLALVLYWSVFGAR
jgi:hypothetical protein